jgi:UDPglucose 6-dehydrogenase
VNITVIGTGYVGLVTGACLAESGHKVTCVDIDQKKIDGLNNGQIPIYEPGLEDMVLRNAKAKRLHFSSDTASSVKGVDVVFFAVGTPPGEDGAADLKYLFAAAETVAAALTAPCVLVTKSTVPVGTARKLWNLLQQHTKHPFDIVSNPEFLKEGDAIVDFMKPDRVVVGCESDHARDVMRNIYEPFVRTDNPILFMDLESSEMTKYASNAFLATKISFMNELARLASATGADIETVRKGMGFDRRIGHLFLFPGVGYGGSCFPKDVKALVALGREKEVPMAVLDAVEEVNDRQKRWLVELVDRKYGKDLKGKAVAVWGLAFKPRTDDIREAPAIVIIDALLERGATVRVTDPVAMEHGRALYRGKNVSFSEDAYAVLEGADAWLVVTEWAEFRRPDFVRIKKAMRTPFVLDGRNIFEPQAMRGLGFDYKGIGR